MNETATTQRRETRLVVVTPTHNRSTQIADLVRMKQTLMLVPTCDWIVVEDADERNPLVWDYLKDFRPGFVQFK